MKCLVIIDMQWWFPSARESWLILNIVDRIKKYIKRNEPIIILEYTDNDNKFGQSVPEILEAVDGYKNCFFRTKMNNDGGKEVSDIMYEQDLDVSEFEVCGVNLDACVMATVVTMSWDYCNIPINIILDCCNSGTNQRDAEDDFNYEMEENDRTNVYMVKS